MPSDNKQPVRYSYLNAELSPSLVRHTFRFISSLSGIEFAEDLNSPNITTSPRDLSGAAGIVFDMSNANVKIGSGDSIIAGHDPIAAMARMLSLCLKSGPYSDRPLTPAPARDLSLSETLANLLGALLKAGLISQNDIRPLWPKPHNFALALTHDIDIANRSLPGSLKLMLNKQLPGGLPALGDSMLASLGFADNPYHQVSQWIKLENERGIKSTYFIFAGPRQHISDPKYRLGKMQWAINELKANGNELALHSSIGDYTGGKLPESKREFQDCIAGEVTGVRPHYMSAQFPDYWRAAASLGFKYSSALGFDRDVGFLRGIDLPIIPFDLASGRAIEIVEIPIAIMDCGLIGKETANSDSAFERGRALIDRTAKSGGLVVLDWHQRTLYERDYPGWGGLCFRLVDYAKSSGAIFVSMAEIARNALSRFRSAQ
jgi:hypothetical protein